MSRLAVRLLTVVALAVSGLLHLGLRSTPYYAAGQLTLGALFLAQGVVALVVAAWVVVRPSSAAYTVAAAVAAATLGALVVSTYVRLPQVGPFPVLYEPVWYAEKVIAAVAAGVALPAALAGRARRVR